MIALTIRLLDALPTVRGPVHRITRPVRDHSGAGHAPSVEMDWPRGRGGSMMPVAASGPTQASRRRRAVQREPVMDWRSRIVLDPKVLVGKPVIKGTRISVELVIDLLARGYTPEQIQQQYDHVTAADIQACLAYASELLRSEKVYALPA